jgi:HD-GYP domain-containing protein (c-di-GMP phosphodiesterase class II)
MFSFAGAALLFIQFKDQHQPYVSSWIIGSILLGTATLLVALKDVAPEFVAYKLGNSLNIAAYIYFYYSCVSLLGKKILFNSVALKAVIAAIIFIVALILMGDDLGVKYQPAFVALCGLVLNSYTGLLTLKFYKQRQVRLAFALTFTFFLTALVWGSRFFMILFGDLGIALQGGAANLITFMLLLVFGIAKYMSFAGLVTSIEWEKKGELITQIHSMKADLANKELELANKKAEQTEVQLLASLNALAKARDNETGNHIIRTQNYVNLLALRLRSEGHYIDQLSDHSIGALVKAAPLHDIGKVGIPDSILLKKGSLNEEEWAVMKTHTTIGESVLGAANTDSEGDADVMAKAIKLAGGHHEKWDGTGYPRGLTGQDIPLEARIMSVADMYDALVTERPYKKAWTHDEAVQAILLKRDNHLDPLIVDAFISEQGAFNNIAKRYKD